MRSSKNRTSEISQKILLFQKRLLNIIFNKVSSDFYALVAAAYPGVERRHPVGGGDGGGDPVPGLLDLVIVQVDPSKGILHLGEQEELRWSEVRAVGRVPDDLEPLGGEVFHDNCSSGDRRVVPVEPPVLLGPQLRPLALEPVQEPVVGVHDVVGVDPGPPQ